MSLTFHKTCETLDLAFFPERLIYFFICLCNLQHSILFVCVAYSTQVYEKKQITFRYQFYSVLNYTRIVSRITKISAVIKVLFFLEFSRISRNYFEKPQMYFVSLIRIDNPQISGYIC